MLKKLSASVFTFFALLTLSAAPALAASHFTRLSAHSGGTSIPLGNDVSWPQCSKSLPGGQAFGIVGVNDGLANNTNPCFSSELSWAQSSSGVTGQPRAALYVNTANPGHLSTLWPTSNSYNGVTVNNPYGTCAGAEDAACAYMYGYERAWDDAAVRNVSSPYAYNWWLDVETDNSWSATDLQTNLADLQGMVDYFHGIGVLQVGLYSTSYQWGQIVGTANTGTSLDGLNSWLPGARSQKAAKSNCSLPALTAGGRVTVTQYVSSDLDYDYSCI